ncbi:MarR family winged helix-turn-helix transcriptional regulator [Mycobacterium stomatepiae]|uniref:MarR family transcriptional regulator n=1 Tax=Mycobacterium stomatepiae TaxID=470076 RepID=A0A7I7QC99_9MYCO|nr:MarR family transcriptional regulator [Mycobacterium stomatepiae]MCV7167971.1 MarR family transcriptional regulator [Mycobacterium stomatepiae]BBY23933.1 MarR family transcriptional regulator [Mycobacterium stomatepiae]
MPAITSAVIGPLVQVSFAVTAVLNRVAAEHDLSLTQLRVLGILRDREPAMAELATYLGLERSTVSGLIDRAVQRGLVRKTTDAVDGRSVRVSLIAQARRLEVRIIAEIGELMEPITGRLNAADQKRLAELLAKMLER